MATTMAMNERVIISTLLSINCNIAWHPSQTKNQKNKDHIIVLPVYGVCVQHTTIRTWQTFQTNPLKIAIMRWLNWKRERTPNKPSSAQTHNMIGLCVGVMMMMCSTKHSSLGVCAIMAHTPGDRHEIIITLTENNNTSSIQYVRK